MCVRTRYIEEKDSWYACPLCSAHPRDRCFLCVERRVPPEVFSLWCVVCHNTKAVDLSADLCQLTQQMGWKLRDPGEEPNMLFRTLYPLLKAV